MSAENKKKFYKPLYAVISSGTTDATICSNLTQVSILTTISRPTLTKHFRTSNYYANSSYQIYCAERFK